MTASTDAFEPLRPRLFAIAYGILGSVADAEDVVQDTWMAWARVDATTVGSATGYLTKAVANRALNRLRDDRRRRQEYIGPWLPEPLDTARRPDEAAELADAVSFAMLVMLERLSPRERAAFLMAEVFDMPGTLIAELLESTPAAVRQLVSRARARIRDETPRFEADRDRHRHTVEAFRTALLEGDVRSAVGLLAPDVVLVSDGGGRVTAARAPVTGPERVLAMLSGLIRSGGDFVVEAADVNGLPAWIIRQAGESPSVIQAAVSDDRIARIWIVRNPDKLTDIVGSGAGETPEPPWHDARPGSP